MKYIYILISLIVLNGCTKNNNDDNLSTNVDLGFKIEYKNKRGEDLLNPLTPEAWKTDEITIFAMDEDGNSISIADEKTSHFVTMMEERGQKKYFIWFIYNYFSNDRTKSIVYIALPNGDTDKIEVHAKRGKNSFVKDKLFYNDVVVWDQSHHDDCITIIK
ncbi:hypothetical protein [Myroides odoratus]|uniref:Uncharacterized protein n=1 Tax=Myroides odoratus TaxID=256 RepID=A0A9Q6Z2R4_MYROD|nr:hypothetical protein [Myroides odoratus]EHQ41732.1 hypothetical protein Myrod_0896 [Myroides odoratus DSM 2801]EKB09041.1 hypothetical protein HMPREF9716_00548 [Myroides odoratus CIP 103059]QQT99137.1 hypothetical protein I6I88_13060 [Myroides odoratus]WQD58670.1 hypothetical protein U0010_05905 [Myroides odoratus]STZ28991.1 Uncharacterised protein [Myroides odoratus]